MIDWTLTIYVAFSVGSFISFGCVAWYFKRNPDLTAAMVVFMLACSMSNLGDGYNRFWYSIWRLIDQPDWMVNHLSVDLSTALSGVGVLGAIWFWTAREFGFKAVAFAAVASTSLGLAANAL